MVALQFRSIKRVDKSSRRSDGVHLLTGVQQRVTRAYHALSNGLVRQSRTINNSLGNSCFVIQINFQVERIGQQMYWKKLVEMAIYN